VNDRADVVDPAAAPTAAEAASAAATILGDAHSGYEQEGEDAEAMTGSQFHGQWVMT
jgi:hypothetical protein